MVTVALGFSGVDPGTYKGGGGGGGGLVSQRECLGGLGDTRYTRKS